MTNTDIVKRLVGNINPIGETTTDNERYENLKAMCLLVNELVSEIDSVHYVNRDSKQYSVKRASDYAGEFIKKTLGIND